MRILVQRYGALGDTLFMTSVIEPLRQQYGPEVKIDLLISRGTTKLFASDPRINQIFPLTSSGRAIPYNPDKLRIIFHALKKPYDMLICIDTANKSLRLARLIRAKEKHLQPACSKEKHIIEVYQDFYKNFLDKKYLAHAIPSLISKTKQDTLNRFGLAKPYIVFCATNSLTSRPRRKNFRAWPAQHWRELLRLTQNMSYDIILLASKHPLEIQFVENLGPFPDNVRTLAGKTNLNETVDIISGAQGVVTTDTGPLHIAAAMNKPILALFGPSDFKHTGPYISHKNEFSTVLTENRYCSPCSHSQLINNCLKNLCMLELTPEKVFQALQGLLAKMIRKRLSISEHVAELD